MVRCLATTFPSFHGERERGRRDHGVLYETLANETNPTLLRTLANLLDSERVVRNRPLVLYDRPASQHLDDLVLLLGAKGVNDVPKTKTEIFKRWKALRDNYSIFVIIMLARLTDAETDGRVDNTLFVTTFKLVLGAHWKEITVSFVNDILLDQSVDPNECWAYVTLIGHHFRATRRLP